MVNISWKRKGLRSDQEKQIPKEWQLQPHPPKKLGSIWCWGGRGLVDLYECPKCKAPFAEFSDLAVLKTKLDRMEQLERCRRQAFDSATSTNRSGDSEMMLRLEDRLEETLDMTYCPLCTNLTLKARQSGFFD
jgi:hypothetical protein